MFWIEVARQVPALLLAVVALTQGRRIRRLVRRCERLRFEAGRCPLYVPGMLGEHLGRCARQLHVLGECSLQPPRPDLYDPATWGR